MDQLRPLGTAISQVAQPTIKSYVPLLVQNAAAIKSTASKTFQYGAHARQSLDVYYPPAPPPSPPSSSPPAKSPILVFLYGGGLVRGDKIYPTFPQGLVHANVGHFFAARHGFTVVVPDYRLLSHGARFPSGGDDVALVVDWTVANLVGSGPERDLYMMGNSAGGIHLTTYLFTPRFGDNRAKILGEGDRLRLKGVVELSVPFHFQKADPSRKEVLAEFYGGDAEQNCPFGLLKAVLEGGGVAKILPRVRFLVLKGELDPEDELLIPNEDFVDWWTTKGHPVAGELQVETMKGHNHISPPFALGTGIEKEEAWGDQVAKFCLSA